MVKDQWSVEQYKEAILRQIQMEELGQVTKRICYLVRKPTFPVTEPDPDVLELLWLK